MGGRAVRVPGIIGCWVIGASLACGVAGPGAGGGVQSLLGSSPPVETGRPSLLAVSVPGCDDTACRCLGPAAGDERAEFVELLNAYRRENGLVTLKYSRRLEFAADGQAQRMAQEGFFGHVSPDGTTVSDRATAAGYCHRRVGENIAYGLNSNDTPGEVMTKFQASEAHDQNLLWPTYRYVGIGVYHLSSDRGEEHWWVQMLGEE